MGDDKRISNPSIVDTDFNEAKTNNGRLLVDWEGLAANEVDAKGIPIKLLGNCFIEGSPDGENYTTTIDGNTKFIRFSSDGGETFRTFSIDGSPHIEKGRLTGLSSREKTILFDENFNDIPICVTKEPLVYREVDIGGGKYRREDVSFYFLSQNWLTVSGFTLRIDDDEDLNGVIIEYIFNEK